MGRFCPLFSGSSGNSTYIGSGDGGILIDAGVAYARILEALSKRGIASKSIRALFITHEHGDHVRSVRTFGKRLGIPIYMSAETAAALINDNMLAAGTDLRIIDDGEEEIEGFTVRRFATSHDCVGSSGYTVVLPDGKKAAVCTDLGVVTDTVRSAIRSSDLVMIESNHDLAMLKNGTYTPALKSRIMSERGHLSNAACAAELPAIVKSGATRIILAHLSRENNLPTLARSSAVAALMDAGLQEDRDYKLYVAPPAGGKMIYI